MSFTVVFGIVSVNSRSVVICRHVRVKTDVETKVWRMINLSMTDIVLFLMVHSFSEVLMSEGFGKRHWVGHDGGLNSNIMNRCDVSWRGDNRIDGSNVGGSSDVSSRSDRCDLSDGILREKRTDVMGEVLSDMASVCRSDFNDWLLVFIQRSVWVVDS